jgi:hypothetical protein
LTHRLALSDDTSRRWTSPQRKEERALDGITLGPSTLNVSRRGERQHASEISSSYPSTRRLAGILIGASLFVGGCRTETSLSPERGTNGTRDVVPSGVTVASGCGLVTESEAEDLIGKSIRPPSEVEYPPGTGVVGCEYYGASDVLVVTYIPYSGESALEAFAEFERRNCEALAQEPPGPVCDFGDAVGELSVYADWMELGLVTLTAYFNNPPTFSFKVEVRAVEGRANASLPALVKIIERALERLP